MTGRSPTPPLTSAAVRAAHGDAWEVLGRERASSGGGTCRLPGVRLMASGLDHPQWNNGDVDDPSAVDLGAVRRWYADLGVPWGLAVPAGAAWQHGRKLFAMRLMGAMADQFRPSQRPAGLAIRVARPGDLDAVLHVDAIAFEASAERQRPWIQPLLDQLPVIVVLAELAGEPVGTGYAVLASGSPRPSLYVAGIAVLPSARRQGVGAAVSSELIARGIERGARLLHLHPDTDQAASVYRRLGFREVEGFDIYVDMA